MPLVENEIVSEEKLPPAHDEQTLAKVLEAAYVLQEHQEELREVKQGLELRRRAESQLEQSTSSSSAAESASPRPTVQHQDSYSAAVLEPYSASTYEEPVIAPPNRAVSSP